MHKHHNSKLVVALQETAECAHASMERAAQLLLRPGIRFGKFLAGKVVLDENAGEMPWSDPAVA